MRRAVRGADAISKFLHGDWDIENLEDWAITFADHPADREDEISMSLAGQILEWLREMGDGIRSQDELDADLRKLRHDSFQLAR